MRAGFPPRVIRRVPLGLKASMAFLGPPGPLGFPEWIVPDPSDVPVVRRPESGAQRLALGLLDAAWHDLIVGRGLERAAALWWFVAERGVRLASFAWCCQALGLEPGWVRQGIWQAWQPRHRPSRELLVTLAALQRRQLWGVEARDAA